MYIFPKKIYEKSSYLRTFFNFIKVFLTNKGFICNTDITTTHKNKIIADEKQLAKLFNSYYINTV